LAWQPQRSKAATTRTGQRCALNLNFLFKEIGLIFFTNFAYFLFAYILFVGYLTRESSGILGKMLEAQPGSRMGVLSPLDLRGPVKLLFRKPLLMVDKGRQIPVI
jgi:hypothetical protein